MYTRSSIEDTAITPPGLYFVVVAFIAANTSFNLVKETSLSPKTVARRLEKMRKSYPAIYYFHRTQKLP
jgi:hypothetical protein